MNYLKESQYTTYVDTIFCYFNCENFLIFRPCFIHYFFEIQCNIMNLIEQSIAAMVARGNHVLHQKVLDQYINCQGTFI